MLNGAEWSCLHLHLRDAILQANDEYGDDPLCSSLLNKHQRHWERNGEGDAMAHFPLTRLIESIRFAERYECAARGTDSDLPAFRHYREAWHIYAAAAHSFIYIAEEEFSPRTTKRWRTLVNARFPGQGDLWLKYRDQQKEETCVDDTILSKG